MCFGARPLSACNLQGSFDVGISWRKRIGGDQGLQCSIRFTGIEPCLACDGMEAWIVALAILDLSSAGDVIRTTKALAQMPYSAQKLRLLPIRLVGSDIEIRGDLWVQDTKLAKLSKL